MLGLIPSLSKKSETFVLLLGMFVVVVFGIIDHLTGPEISFSVFYLIPISLVTWSKGGPAGLVIAVLSAVAWLIADLTTGHVYSYPVIPYWNMIVRFAFFVVVNFTLSGLKKSLEHEKILARTDSLTGAVNSRYFMELAGNEIDRCNRYKHPIALVYIDCDNFKTVNDQLGHQQGDALLVVVAETIQKGIRAIDVVARLGGDEFAVLLPETGGESVRDILNRLQGQLADSMRKNNWPVTFSFGVAIFKTPPKSVDEMIRYADDLMYSAKRSGKNMSQFKVFDG